MRFSGLRNREIAVNASISENDRTTKLSVRNGLPEAVAASCLFCGVGVAGFWGVRGLGSGLKSLGRGRLMDAIR